MEAAYKTCPNHREYVVPLIMTSAFPGAELWCPYCNCQTGWPFGNTVEAMADEELANRRRVYKRMAEPYLNAVGTLSCYSLEWPRGSGRVIRRNELPSNEEARCSDIVAAGWTFKGTKAEEWKEPAAKSIFGGDA